MVGRVSRRGVEKSKRGGPSRENDRSKGGLVEGIVGRAGKVNEDGGVVL